MPAMPLVLAMMMSLVEEMEGRIRDAETTLEALKAQTISIEDGRIRTAAHLGALHQELRARAISLGALREEDCPLDDEPGVILEKIREAFSENDRVAVAELISLESWRRSQSSGTHRTTSSIALTDELSSAIYQIPCRPSRMVQTSSAIRCGARALRKRSMEY
jgi:hypothetical protein